MMTDVLPDIHPFKVIAVTVFHRQEAVEELFLVTPPEIEIDRKLVQKVATDDPWGWETLPLEYEITQMSPAEIKKNKVRLDECIWIDVMGTVRDSTYYKEVVEYVAKVRADKAKQPLPGQLGIPGISPDIPKIGER